VSGADLKVDSYRDGERSPASGITPVSGYIPGLDGMRAIAVGLVVFGHSGLSFAPAAIGVTIFFFLSGFLITHLLVSEQQKHGAINVKAFYIRRYLRLMPEQAFYVAVGLLVGLATGALPALINTVAALFYFTNYLKIFAIGHEALPMVTGHFWSLAVEEHFYLLWPLVFFWAGRNTGRLIGVVIAVLITCLIWRIIALHTSLPPIYVGYASEARLDSIGYGCLGALLVRRYSRVLEAVRRVGLPILLAGAVILTVPVVWRLMFGDRGLFLEAGRYTVQGLGFICCFAYLFARPQMIWVRLLELPLLRFVGRASYGLYLWHFAVIYSFMMLAGYDQPSAMPINLRLTCAVTAMTIAAIIGHLSATYVLAPFNPLRRRFGSHVAVA
jgi:peptidoglycan/LPS O-acetylase OafA/YrhL